MVNPSRVAAEFAKKANNVFGDIDREVLGAHQVIERLKGYAQIVDDLITAGERRRINRVSDVKVGQTSFDGNTLESKVNGTTGIYNVRITIAPSRGHHCTCPDWEKNGRNVGPCKHVMALALTWKSRSLVPAAESVVSSLSDIAWTPIQ